MSNKNFKWAKSRTRGTKLVDDITNIRWWLWSNKAAFWGPDSDRIWVVYLLIVSVEQNSTSNTLSRARKVVLFHFAITILNITKTLLKEVCKDIPVEPQLQERAGEILHPSTITGNEVKLDICARAFWQAGQMAFFDVRVFNPTAKWYVIQEIPKTYEVNEREKKKLYNERILQIEHGSFTPLVMSAAGGMGRECKKFYARLAEMMRYKKGTSYSVIAAWVRRKIKFSLIKSIGMCLRGSRYRCIYLYYKWTLHYRWFYFYKYILRYIDYKVMTVAL